MFEFVMTYLRYYVINQPCEGRIELHCIDLEESEGHY